MKKGKEKERRGTKRRRYMGEAREGGRKRYKEERIGRDSKQKRK